MTMQNGFKSHILQLIADQRAEKRKLEGSIQEQLEKVESRISALETTLDIYEESNRFPSKRSKFPVSPEEVRANTRTQMEALRFIARHNEGKVNYAQARDILVEARMTKGKSRNVASHLYNLMAESDEWKKVSPGTFRLKSGQTVVLSV